MVWSIENVALSGWSACSKEASARSSWWLVSARRPICSTSVSPLKNNQHESRINAVACRVNRGRLIIESILSNMYSRVNDDFYYWGNLYKPTHITNTGVSHPTGEVFRMLQFLQERSASRRCRLAHGMGEDHLDARRHCRIPRSHCPDLCIFRHRGDARSGDIAPSDRSA